MSSGKNSARRQALVLGVAVLAAAPALALAPAGLQALSQLERGRWEIVESGGGRRAPVCLGDPMQLVRLEHRGGSCTVEAAEPAADGGTVQYSCPGRGFGHTHVRVETPRLAKIDTQGLVGGRPFAYRAEARRVGAC